jgi:hypothetical protein
MPVPIFTDLVIIFGLSLVVLFVCHQFRVPVTVGFILFAKNLPNLPRGRANELVSM